MKGRQRTATQRARGVWSMTLTRFLAWLVAHSVMRLRVQGRDRMPPDTGVLLAVNHTAFIDGPIVYGLTGRPTVFLIKAEAFRGPIGVMLRSIGQIPVRRGQAERAPLVAALETLAAGGVVGIFPEGTRGTGDVSHVEHGIAYLALRSNCPVVPVACIGTGAVLPRGRKLPRLRRRVRVVFGEPVTVSRGAGAGMSRRSVAEAAEEIRTVLAKHVLAATDDSGSGGPAAEGS